MDFKRFAQYARYPRMRGIPFLAPACMARFSPLLARIIKAEYSPARGVNFCFVDGFRKDTPAVNRLVLQLVSKPLSAPTMGAEIGAAESTRVAGGATGTGLCHRTPHQRNSHRCLDSGVRVLSGGHRARTRRARTDQTIRRRRQGARHRSADPRLSPT